MITRGSAAPAHPRPGIAPTHANNTDINKIVTPPSGRWQLNYTHN